MRRQLLACCPLDVAVVVVILVVVPLLVSACGPAVAAQTIDPPAHPRAEPLSSTEAMLSWDPVEDATAIRVERRDGLEAPFVEVGVTGGEAASHLNTGLTPGATYVWRVRACRGDRCSDYSAFTTLVLPVP